MPRTNRPTMKPRPLRCSDPQWAPVEAEAEADGVSESEVVRRALRYYFERHGSAGAGE